MIYSLGPRAQLAYDRLRERILSGELPIGSRLPPHTELAAAYGVASFTMRQALARLEQDGLVSCEQGRGTFVRSNRPESELPYRSLVERLPVATYVRPAESMAPVLYISPQIEAMLGYSRAEWIADPGLWARLLHPDDRERVLAAYARHIETDERFRTEYRVLARNGQMHWVRDEAIIVQDEPGGRRLQHGVMIDIGEAKQAEAALEYQALHDALTDLPNRTLLFDRLQQAVATAHRDMTPVALLSIDLDRFKTVNDTLGHHYGDLLLQQVGGRLRSAMRESDTVARVGGDEFAAVLPDTDERGACEAARKILTTLERPFMLDGQSFSIGASVGIALYPEHGMDADVLLRRADAAMYAAKHRNGGYSVSVLDEEDDHVSFDLAAELRSGIDEGQIVVHYQPMIDVRTRRPDGVEALVRWQHPERGLLLPAEFIPLAEQTGLIKPLTLWLLSVVSKQSCLWRAQGLNVRIAVNLSARTLYDSQFAQAIVDLIRWRSIDGDAELLGVEITESAIMADPDRAKHLLGCLHSLGVKISIDDFGTGYSSLAYLKGLPVDSVKIDRSFVSRMAESEDAAIIANSIINLGHNLGFKVIAEGVESRLVMDVLTALGCDLAQGEHLCPPLTAATLTDFAGQLHLAPAALER